jgi:hypothetical protein
MRRENYKSGELVLVRSSEQEMRLNRKTKPQYLGPYEVCRKTTYVLKELDGSILKERVAAFHLLPYVSRRDKSLLKLITREMVEESEESDTDNDWYSSTSNNDFEEEED